MPVTCVHKSTTMHANRHATPVSTLAVTPACVLVSRVAVSMIRLCSRLRVLFWTSLNLIGLQAVIEQCHGIVRSGALASRVPMQLALVGLTSAWARSLRLRRSRHACAHRGVTIRLWLVKEPALTGTGRLPLHVFPLRVASSPGAADGRWHLRGPSRSHGLTRALPALEPRF